MKWQDIQTKLIAKDDKEACLDFAIACAEKALPFSDSSYVTETLPIIKANRWNHKVLTARFQPLAIIRVNQNDVGKRESAHVMIHAVELAGVNSLQGWAAHAARCGEALSRISEDLCGEVITQFEL